MRIFLISLSMLFLSLHIFAESKSDQEKVKETIHEMFALVEDGKSNKLANYIVYRGKNEKRKWKSACKYSIPEEKHQVQNIHQRIVDRYLPYKYRFVKFSTQKESEGEWLVWEMEFLVKEKSKKVFFAFLKVGDRYLLGDID